MKFDRERAKTIENVSEKQLLHGLSYMHKPSDCRIAILTADDGSYVQVGGSGQCCVLEWRQIPSQKHFRAFQNPPAAPWPGITKLKVSGGTVDMQQDEFFRMTQVQDAFVAFFRGNPFPSFIQWRDITTQLQ